MPPWFFFCIFHWPKQVPSEEKKAPLWRKKSAPLKSVSAHKFTSAPQKRYRDTVWLRRHMKDVHNMSELCRCNICGKQFLTDTRLYNHSSKKHTVNIISYYECKICEYKTMNKYYLSDHTKRQHAGDDSNSFVCHMCYVRKPNSYLLKKHMQQHVESVCKVCEKQFNSTKNLKRHGKVHEGQGAKTVACILTARKT